MTGRPGRFLEALVWTGAAVAVTGTAQTWVNARVLRRPVRPVAATAERISVLLPVRDEAPRVADCVRSLLAQRGVPGLEILVLDDGSSDGTNAVVAQVAGADPRLRLLDGGQEGPPTGWLGKPWACHRLGVVADGSVLIFVDADVVVAPDGIAASVDLLRRSGLALVSPYPRQVADGFLQRLVQPLLQWSWLTLLPLRIAERSDRPSLSAANGQLLVVDAASYRAAGGHAAVRSEVLEDMALLKGFKRVGLRGGVVDGTDVAECRMYDDAAALIEGYTKSLWSALGHPAAATAVLALLGLGYVVPPVAVLMTAGRTRRVAVIGYAAGVAGRVIVARRTGQRVWPDVAAQPLSILALAALTVASYRRHARGTLRWKGRAIQV